LKLLLDENLPQKIVSSLQVDFPGSSHVCLVGLQTCDDRRVWAYARANGFWIVTKDADFYEMTLLYGAPPKVIWLRFGNCRSGEILDRLLGSATRLAEAATQDDKACVEIF
jgi:predicted nuclease of predicted toxin-antitoxin system